MKRSTRRRLPVLLLVICAPLTLSYSQPEDDAAAPAALVEGEAGVCEPDAIQDGVQARIAARATRGEVAEGVILLNGQGYNYGAQPNPGLAEVPEAVRRSAPDAR